jgi:ubiquinone/menaquinone biosynthesis C-methylase UbiE
MPSKDERYVIRGGREGYDRLLVLARSRWPDTKRLLQRAGVAAGMHCLDVGCGGGSVSLEIAKLVGPGGSVVGLDMDEVKLELARQAAAEQQVRNVEFRCGNVNDWNEPGAYDVVVSRFVLQHLREPLELLRRMWDGVRPGGVLLVEDAEIGGCFSDPPNEGLDFYVRTYCEALERAGGDPWLGRKLPRLFREAGIPGCRFSLFQPANVSGEEKTLPLLTLEATREAILSTGVAGLEELRSALASLSKFTDDPGTLIAGPRIFQAWSRREPTAKGG